jgi:hypothetical protein
MEASKLRRLNQAMASLIMKLTDGRIGYDWERDGARTVLRLTTRRGYEQTPGCTAHNDWLRQCLAEVLAHEGGERT